MARYRDSERGMSLMIVLLVMMLLSALMIGFMANVMADARSSGVDRDETQAYAAAHAGMEKLTSDLAALFQTDYSPNGTQISAVAATSKQPVIPGFTYADPDGSTGYKVQFNTIVSGTNTPVSTPTTAIPAPDDPTTGTTIAAGPYQGFKGLVTHYNIMVTARSLGRCAATDTACLLSYGGSEVRMRRELQTVAVPVFQFGLFSESSLAFHSADNFNFGGRVHTNGNLYLAGGNGSPAGQLWLGDKVTAVGEVVRRYLDNGLSSLTSYPGAVNMAKGTGVYRVLSATNNSGKGEGSVVNDVGSAQNEPTWTTLSVGTYNGYIRNGRTGAKRLDLPLVSAGAEPIDLIRRPVASENTTKPLVYQQRYYTQASLRILLSDTAADITALPGVTGDAPVSLETGIYGGTPIGTSMGSGNYLSAITTSLIGGFLKIEKQDNSGTWTDVTAEIMALGITGRNLSNGAWNTVFTGGNGQNATSNGCLGNEPRPDAIVRVQRVKDRPSTNSGAMAASYRYDCATMNSGVMSAVSTDYWPLALYDTREGLRRDESATPANRLYPNGVMYYVELDTNNLARWFRGTIGTTGSTAKNDNGGYIVYFSDRRNNRNASDGTSTADGRMCGSPAVACFAGNAETGEYGYEDLINFTTVLGPDDAVNNVSTAGEKPEDVNVDNVLETYGRMPNEGKGTYNSLATIGPIAPFDSSLRPYTPFVNDDNNKQQLRGNRPLLFRRALKLTNGANLRTSGLGGLTIASENPVYVQGSYNSTPANTATETHIAAAIIADAITVLSNSWNDIASFNSGTGSSSYTAHAGMAASDTGYRFAAVMGKNISFTQPTNWGGSPNPETNFGMDGGAHNLLRQQEDWSSATLFYRGSIVSFYISRQATGIFKCCNYVYRPPNSRVYNFDTDFLLPDKLPPGTPMFRDVNTLTFRQILRPNQ